jgi:transcriptional regulator with XRE-family HTH domain
MHQGGFMTLEEIKKRLEFMNLAKVGRACGISREMLSRFMRGDSKGMSLNMYMKLSKFFETQGGSK